MVAVSAVLVPDDIVPDDIVPDDMEPEDDMELSDEAAGASAASAAPVMPANSNAGIAIFKIRMVFSLGCAGGSARQKM